MLERKRRHSVLWVLVLVTLVASIGAYTIEAIADRVTYLPLAQLRFNMFSGFMYAGGGKHIHYIFTESQGDPAKDPVVFWTNGGPGCSGLLGFTTEMGPWRPAWADSNRTSLELVDNPYAWNKLANVVYLEQPAGVGFSYAEDDTTYSELDDATAAADNVQVLRGFYRKFPEYKSNRFFISSESYGGHYMPQLALELMKSHNNDLPPLHGILVGNPYTSFASGDIAGAVAAWNMQVVPRELWDRFTKYNCDDLSLTADEYSETCTGLLEEVCEVIEGLNRYALELPTCPYATHGDNDDGPTDDDTSAAMPSSRSLSGGVQPHASPQARMLFKVREALRLEKGRTSRLQAATGRTVHARPSTVSTKRVFSLDLEGLGLAVTEQPLKSRAGASSGQEKGASKARDAYVEGKMKATRRQETKDNGGSKDEDKDEVESIQAGSGSFWPNV